MGIKKEGNGEKNNFSKTLTTKNSKRTFKSVDAKSAKKKEDEEKKKEREEKMKEDKEKKEKAKKEREEKAKEEKEKREKALEDVIREQIEHEQNFENLQPPNLDYHEVDPEFMHSFISDEELFCGSGHNLIGKWAHNENRGGRPYNPPEGWIGFGLNVINKYDNEIISG